MQQGLREDAQTATLTCCAAVMPQTKWVSYLLFVLCCVCIGFLEHTRLSTTSLGPDLSVAFLAYVIVASSEKSVLIRAWFLGLAMDLWNPYTTAWYTFWYLALAVCFLPLRAWVFQRSYSGWFLWALIVHVIMCDLHAGDGQWYASWSRVLADACFTGIFAIALGALANELPRLVHPLGGPDLP